MTTKYNFYKSQSILCDRTVIPNNIAKQLIQDHTKIHSLVTYSKEYEKYVAKSNMPNILTYFGNAFDEACLLSCRWYGNRRAFYRVYPEIIEHVIKKGIDVDRQEKIDGIDASSTIIMPPISFEFMKVMPKQFGVTTPKTIIIEKNGDDFRNLENTVDGKRFYSHFTVKNDSIKGDHYSKSDYVRFENL